MTPPKPVQARPDKVVIAIAAKKVWLFFQTPAAVALVFDRCSQQVLRRGCGSAEKASGPKSEANQDFYLTYVVIPKKGIRASIPS